MIKTIPATTSTAITIWPTASRLIVRILVRSALNASAPSARPIRKTARIVVKTYVESPVPDASSRVHRTW
jgi:hypothetical protein